MGERILLDLSDHCIQTAAKHEHARLLAQLLDESAADPGAEAQLQMLTEFLESTDFRALRAEQPPLRGGSTVIVRLERADVGAIVWSIVEAEG